MVNKRFWVGILGMLLVFGIILASCTSYTPPKYSPLTSMTVVLVQRYPAQNEEDAKAVMEIYIDDNLKANVEDNRFAVVPVNDGVHNILVKVGKLESERLNFTANQRSVPFLATIETKITGALFWKKRTSSVKLERSTIVDDTGVMTGKQAVETYTPQR